MCTLTIFKTKKRIVVTMNRDERRTRRESGLLNSHTCRDVRLFYPVDVSSGGSWFGVNNRGVILALLNRYQGTESASAMSRGDIIPQALEQGGHDAVGTWLKEMDTARYNPFDLYLATRRQVHRFSWNGVDWLSEEIPLKHWFMVTSSGLLIEEVIAFRKSCFQAWSSEMGKKLTDADEIIRGFHLIQIAGMESHSVLMEREHSHTKSVTQADINGRELTLKYLPGILEKPLAAPFADAQVQKLDIRKS